MNNHTISCDLTGGLDTDAEVQTTLSVPITFYTAQLETVPGKEIQKIARVKFLLYALLQYTLEQYSLLKTTTENKTMEQNKTFSSLQTTNQFHWFEG